MEATLPPGPRTPSAVQTLAWWARPIPFLERCRSRYGPRFTIPLLGQPPFVMLSDPDEVKVLFTAPADVLHPGEGARILEPVVGRNSVILLDEEAHLEQRKLLLPAFHGERVRRLERLVSEVAEREVARWPRGETIPLHPRLQALTLEVILRAVFGLEAGERLASPPSSRSGRGRPG
jgi:cytochrome P450